MVVQPAGGLVLGIEPGLTLALAASFRRVFAILFGLLAFVSVVAVPRLASAQTIAIQLKDTLPRYDTNNSQVNPR